MSAQIVLLTIHGQGVQCSGYAKPLQDEVRNGLGSDKDRVHFGSIYYQDILQSNQKTVFEQMRPYIDWKKLRRLLLYYFSDATSIETKKEESGSVYERVQIEILGKLDEAYTALGHRQAPVVIVAHSLGGHVISNYLWDSQRRNPCKKEPGFGVWRDGNTRCENSGSRRDEFRRLKSLRMLFTTGCNIPIFVAGHANIAAIKPPHADFKWLNYYDEDDVLGWPLRPLSPSYCKLVKDYEINVDGLLTSWNFWSHMKYWEDKDFLTPLIERLKSLLK